MLRYPSNTVARTRASYGNIGHGTEVEVGVRRVLVVLAIAGAIVPLSAGPSWACSCANLPPKEHARMADVVFSGRAVGVEEGTQIDVAHFLVTDVYKGPRTGRLIVETSAHGPACGFDFVAGRRYTVFAFQDGGPLHTNLCTATTAGDIDADRFGLPEPLRLTQPALRKHIDTILTSTDRWPHIAGAFALATLTLGGLLTAGRRLRA